GLTAFGRSAGGEALPRDPRRQPRPYTIYDPYRPAGPTRTTILTSLPATRSAPACRPRDSRSAPSRLPAGPRDPPARPPPERGAARHGPHAWLARPKAARDPSAVPQ